MPEPDTPITPGPQDTTVPVQHISSKPGGAHHTAEGPLPHEVQAMLPADAYVVESFLGRGGMGTVYRGLQMPLRRPVAIKILRKGEGDEFGFEERFKREAYAMASLTHPHIVQVHDCGDAGEDHLFISMEFVEGGDLGRIIAGGGMTPERGLELAMQICDALQFAHDRGIVHRDIKPANILLTKQGEAKVADFGLAKRFNAENSFMTQTGLGMGTPDYAAPEQFLGARDLDHRADLFSLGVMLYQMITGVLPRGGYRPPSQRAGADERLDAIVYKAMEHERADRYQSAAEMKADLAVIAGTGMKSSSLSERATTRTPASSARTSPTPQRAVASAVARRPTKRSSLVLRSALAAGALAVLAWGAWMALKAKPSPGTSGDGGPTSAVSPPAAPAVAWKPLFTEEEWQRAGESGRNESVDGLRHLRGVKASKLQAFPDCAIRARIHFRTGSKYVSLIARGLNKDDTYKYEIHSNREIWLMAIESARLEKYQLNYHVLGKHKLPEPIKPGDTVELELRIQGNRLTGLVNGAMVIEARDDRLPNPGEWGILADDGWYESVELGIFSPAPQPESGRAPQGS